MRRVAICTEFGQLLVSATLAVLTLGGWIQVWQIFALALLQGIGQSIGGPARHALVFQMVGPEDLANAVGLNSSLGTTARVVGPAIGGAIVALAGAGVAFAVNSGTFLAEIVALLAIDVSKLHLPLKDHGATLVGGALDALRFVVHNTRAGVAFFGVLVVSTFAFNLNVLFPLLAKRTLDGGAGTFGLIAAVFGAGALLGALAAARRGSRSLKYLLGGMFLYGALELILAPQTSVERRLRAPVLHRHRVHQLGRNRAHGDPARGAGAPARPGREPLLLGVPRRRADRRAVRRLARLDRRNGACVLRRGLDRRDDGRRRDGPAAARERPHARERAGTGVAAAVVTAVRLIPASHPSMTCRMGARDQSRTAKGQA